MKKYSIQFITRGSEEWASWNGIADGFEKAQLEWEKLPTMRCNKKKKKLKQIAKYVKSYEIPCSFCETVRWEWHEESGACNLRNFRQLWAENYGIESQLQPT